MIKRRPFVAAVLLFLLIAAAGSGYLFYRCVHPASLAAWTETVARPEFKLRYRTRTKTHDLAVFQVGPDRLAFCSRRRVAAPGQPSAEVRVTDVAGNSLVDFTRPGEQLRRVWQLGVIDYPIVDGLVIPIQPDFDGRMRIIFETHSSASEDAAGTSQFDVHLQWGAMPEELRDDADPGQDSLPRC